MLTFMLGMLAGVLVMALRWGRTIRRARIYRAALLEILGMQIERRMGGAQHIVREALDAACFFHKEEGE